MLVLGGCAQPGGTPAGGVQSSAFEAAAPRTSVFHLVFFQLTDPGQVEALKADCDRLLAGIPGVQLYACGRHLDTGRDVLVADYDLALMIGFSDESAYRAYVVHPDHRQLVSLWKPRFQQVVVRDFSDPAP